MNYLPIDSASSVRTAYGDGVPQGGDVFVGRETELGTVITMLLGRPRVITLVGPGGFGKTRLAIEAIRRYRKPSGAIVRWVRLARLAAAAPAAAIEEEIARSVSDTDFSGRPAWEALVESLGETDGAHGPRGTVVLVLDNCEHVLPAITIVVQRLLSALPALKVLATSREPLRWVHEHRVVVDSLSGAEAAELFRHRADMVGRSVPDDHIVWEICRRLDNSPLCIELAAARLARMPITDVRRELSADLADDQRLRWRDEQWHGFEARHRRVADVIDWSYRLCSEKERLLLDRMAVFAAGADVDPDESRAGTVYERGANLSDVRAVCSDSVRPAGDSTRIRLSAEEIGDLLSRLVDRSLVSAHFTTGEVRYSLVESVRLFAEHRLRERGEGEGDEWTAAVERHMHYYRDQVVDAAGHWFGSEERHLLDWAQGAWDNILTAIDRSVAAPNDPEIGLQICAGLLRLRLPFFKGSFREVRNLTERALAATRRRGRPPTDLELSTIALTAWIALCQGETDDARRLLDDCVAQCPPHPLRPQRWRDSVEIDTGLPAAVEFAWGNELFVLRDPRSTLVLTRAKGKFEKLDDHGAASVSELIAALAAALLGADHDARTLAAQLRAHAADSGTSWAKAWADLVWGLVLSKQGEAEAALPFERAALERQLESRERWAALWSVQAHAWTLAHLVADWSATRGADNARITALATDTARLLGGTTTLRAQYGVTIERLGPFQDETLRAEQTIRRVLGAKAFTIAETEGARMDPTSNDVHMLALGLLRHRPAHTTRPASDDPAWHRLTGSEQHIAVLAAAGWTDTAIAARRGSSIRTVNAQMASVRRKLDLTSRKDVFSRIPAALRAEVAAEAARLPGRA